MSDFLCDLGLFLYEAALFLTVLVGVAGVILLLVWIGGAK